MRSLRRSVSAQRPARTSSRPATAATPESFRRAVKSAHARVIVAGGPLSSGSDEAVLELAADCVNAGADGIVFGRNVWQHPRMEKMLAALCAIVHEDETVARARKLLR